MQWDGPVPRPVGLPANRRSQATPSAAHHWTTVIKRRTNMYLPHCLLRATGCPATCRVKACSGVPDNDCRNLRVAWPWALGVCGICAHDVFSTMAKWEKYLMVAMGVTTFAGLAGLLYMRRDPQFVAEVCTGGRPGRTSRLADLGPGARVSLDDHAVDAAQTRGNGDEPRGAPETVNVMRCCIITRLCPTGRIDGSAGIEVQVSKVPDPGTNVLCTAGLLDQEHAGHTRRPHDLYLMFV